MFKAYFNSREEFPLIWSVESREGDIVRVQQIVIAGCRMHTAHNLSADNMQRPVAWIEIEAEQIVVLDNVAYFGY